VRWQATERGIIRRWPSRRRAASAHPASGAQRSSDRVDDEHAPKDRKRRGVLEYTRDLLLLVAIGAAMLVPTLIAVLIARGTGNPWLFPIVLALEALLLLAFCEHLLLPRAAARLGQHDRQKAIAIGGLSIILIGGAIVAIAVLLVSVVVLLLR
jgi:hypothetical protein